MSTRYDVTNISFVGSDSSGLSIVGGNPTCLHDSDNSTYVEWNPSLQGTSVYRATSLSFPTFDWPTGPALFTVCYRIQELVNNDGSVLAPDPYPPNAAYNIGLRLIQGTWYDDANNYSAILAGTVEVHTDLRQENDTALVAVTVPIKYPELPITDLTHGSYGSNFNPNVPLTLLGAVSQPNGWNYAWRMLECWVEISNVGEQTTLYTPPGQISMFSSGFYGESVLYGQLTNPYSTPSSGNGTGNPVLVRALDIAGGTNPLPSVGWNDGSYAQPNEYIGGISIGSRDRSGGWSNFLAVPDILNWNNGISIVPDVTKGTALVFWDHYDSSPDNADTTPLMFAEVSSGGSISTGEKGVIYWDGRNGRVDTHYLPSTGGVYNNVLTYTADYFSGNWLGPPWASAILTMDLTTGARTCLGSNDAADAGLPFSHLLPLSPYNPDFMGTHPQGTNWGMQMMAMAVDPRDGSYWFIYNGGSYLEPAWGDWYDEGGNYSANVTIVRTDRDTGTVQDIYAVHCDGDGYNMCNELQNIQVDNNGIVYYTSVMNAFTHPQAYDANHNNYEFDEWDSVYFFDSKATFPIGHNGFKLVSANPWEGIIMPTGIWNTGALVWLTVNGDTPPLRMRQRDDHRGVGVHSARMNNSGSRNRPTSMQSSARIIKNTEYGYR